MAISDTSIKTWSIDGTNTSPNLPTNGTLIGRDLAGQWRNIKSVVRAESFDKEFNTLTLNTPSAASANPTASITFGSDGDVTAQFPADAKLRLTPIDGVGDTVYAGVQVAIYSAPNTVVTLTEFSGLVITGQDYLVALGVGLPQANALPAYAQAGSTTITGASVSSTVTLTRTEPNVDYFVKATLISTNSGNNDSYFVSGITKNQGNFTMTLLGAPGGTNSNVIGWTLLRPM